MRNEYQADPPSPSSDLDEVRRLVTRGLQGYRARLFLFGSWATGNAGPTSDIDVAVMPIDPIPREVLSDIREALEESLVVCPVDLVDLSEASDDFRQRILREGVPWND